MRGPITFCGYLLRSRRVRFGNKFRGQSKSFQATNCLAVWEPVANLGGVPLRFPGENRREAVSATLRSVRANHLNLVSRRKAFPTMKSAGPNQPSPKLTKETAPGLDPVSYISFKEDSYRENLRAWSSVQFRRPANDRDQYIDVGCGPGTFLKEHQLPRLRPCRRVVATDCSQDMLEYARRHSAEPEVTFDLFDIERGDPQIIVDKYGQFDRLYSFLTFQYVCDLEKAYRSVYRLLKDGGECLVVYFTRTDITDAWHRIYHMEEWREYTPDPTALLADRFRFNSTVPDDDLVAHEKRAVTAAGLDMVDCHTYSSQWTFPSVDACLDPYFSFYKLDAKVPAEKQSAFRDTWRSAFLEMSTATTDGISFQFHLLVAHSQKPLSSS